MKLDIETAHRCWNDCVRRSWESLKPKLYAMVERRCEHKGSKICLSCKLERRMTLYAFLWADFDEPSAPEDPERLKAKEMAEWNAIIIFTAQTYEPQKDDRNLPPMCIVSRGDKAMLQHLEKL